MKNRLFGYVLALPLLFSAMAAGAGGPPPIDRSHTAVLITDPQNDFLREEGKLYGLLADNLKQLNTMDNLEALMRTAKQRNILLVVDPLVLSRRDAEWIQPGGLQRQLLEMKALQRSTTGEDIGSGASGGDFFARYQPYIEDGKTLITSPHKMYGPESNDLIYQLRSRGIDTVILGGLVANLCVDSHMRTLMENGFRVFVVKDAVAAPGPEAYQAALTNFGMIANGVWSTAEALAAMGGDT